MNEFELIRRYFSGDVDDPDVRLGIGDDGAVLHATPDNDLVVVVDTLVESVHFPAGFPAADTGFRSVAVNLSDVAAMGARPRWMTLALTLDSADESWLRGFADGLRSAAREHGVSLVGGDTTRGEQAVITVQLIAEASEGRTLRRCGAMPGDYIFVSGTVGDAAAGLRLIQSASDASADANYLKSRFSRPTARVTFGRSIVGVATAAIDVSDGLLGDLQKLLSESRLGGDVNIDDLPLSPALLSCFDRESAVDLALTGGDDYELCFTAPPHSEAHVRALAAKASVAVTCIGRVWEGTDVVCTRDGVVVDYDHAGYSHFGEGD